MERGVARRGNLIFDALGNFKPVAKDSNSTECIQQLDAWIQDCIQNHCSCRPINSSDEYFLPTRLLDVGVPDSDFNSVRLVPNSDLRTKNDARYLALSHCWENAIPKSATTTLATLDSRLQSIPVETLTKNFRDICLLARKLGVGYVWIDSLCIIQDSLEDWTMESRVMGKVFSHSYCTVGAALHPRIHDLENQQSSGETGFLAPRPARATGMATLLNPLYHGALQQSSDVPTVSMAPREDPQLAPKQMKIFPVLPEWNQTYSACSLRYRGWTLQERELSVRNVFYTRDQMIWECQKMQTTEQFPTPRKHDKTSTRLFPSFSQDKAVNLHQWYNMVEDYTNRKLSYQTDKLPAISGLAESFEVTTGLTRYIAGLWEEDLIEGLLWSIEPRSPWLSEEIQSEWSQGEYLAPSWSWASVGEPVQWWSRHLVKHWSSAPNQHTKPCVLECETISQGSDPRGRLTGGSLRVEGILKILDSLPKLLVHNQHTIYGSVMWDFQARVIDNSDRERGFFVLPIYLAPEDGHIRHSLGLLLTDTGENDNTYRRLGLVYELPPAHYQDLERQVITIV